MPRSPNRRTIEVPTALYEQLKAEAESDGSTIPQVLQGHLANSRTMHEYWAELSSQVHELRREVREIAEELRRSKDRTDT